MYKTACCDLGKMHFSTSSLDVLIVSIVFKDMCCPIMRFMARKMHFSTSSLDILIESVV